MKCMLFYNVQNEKHEETVEPNYIYQPVNEKQLHKYGKNVILEWLVVCFINILGDI